MPGVASAPGSDGWAWLAVELGLRVPSVFSSLLSLTISALMATSKANDPITGQASFLQHYLVNYGDRYRNGETISTAFVESTVNEVISKRFVKKQQMRWTKAGAHNLLQVRTQVLNDDFYQLFCKWYPGMVEPAVSS